MNIIKDGQLHSDTQSGYPFNYICNSSQVGYLVLHGGGWTQGSIDDYPVDDICEELFAKRGKTVVNLHYPLATATVHSSTMVGWLNDAAQDIMTAVGVKRWILVGTSAGANLGALIARLNPHLYESFCGFYGVYDLTKDSEMNTTVNQRKAVFVPGADYSNYSPTLKTWPDELPAYLWHGDADATVYLEQSIDFAVQCEGRLDIIPGAIHGFKAVDYL